tara:strand:+ start:10427 stop:11713 length:1287 start_codon:yes stop_codon:yes gene_type:complete
MTIYKKILFPALLFASQLFAANNLPQQLKIPEHNNHIGQPANNKIDDSTLNNLITPSSPDIDATSYILLDSDSGEVIASKNPDMQVSPASLTKIMTMHIISKELQEGKIKLTDLVNISTKAWKMPGSRMFIEPDTNVPVSELIKGIVIQSGNDASIAMAEYIAGSEDEFVNLMNYEAQNLNLKNTHFENATGLPHKNHVSTARDMAALSKEVIENYPEYYKLYKEKDFTYNNIKQYNRNKLLWRKSLNVDGLKTGFTDSAGYCQVTSAKTGNHRLISVVMGSNSEDERAKNSATLIKYGFKHYETKKLFSDNMEIKEVPVWMGDKSMVPAGVIKSTYITIPKNTYSQLKYILNIKTELKAPIKKNMQVGTIDIMLNNNILKQVPLVALASIEKGGIWTKTKDYISLSVLSIFNKNNNEYTTEEIAKIA